MHGRRSWAGLAALAMVVATAPLVLATAPAAPATFPGTNGAIAFTRLADDEVTEEIWLTNADGSSLVQLTHDTNDWDPAFSPDGSRIAFVSNRSGTAQIYVMGIDGSGVTRLTTDGGGWPTWSPDGTRILYSGPGEDLWVMDADGTDAVQLTDTPEVEELYPTWSPDGTRIVYAVDSLDAPIYDPALYVMDADGTDPVLLTDIVDTDFMSSWSPDGTRIAFSCAVEGLGFPDQLCTVAPDGSQLTVLTEQLNPSGSAFFVPEQPSWSPDGTKIVFRSTRGIGGQLNVMDAAGTTVSRITEHEYGSNWSPSWGSGYSSKTLITGFTPDPPITGLEYPVSGTVAVDPEWPHPRQSLPGSVVVSDGTQSCWSDANPTETAGNYTFSCVLTAGAPGSVDVTARFGPDPGVAIMPSEAWASNAVVEMPGPPTNVHATSTGARYTVLSWDAPDGPVPTGYQIRCIPLGLPATTGPAQNPAAKWVASLTSPLVVSGFTRGLSYHCMVRARYGLFYDSELGDKYEGPLSQWSETFAVPVVLPAVPQEVRAITPAPPRRQSTRVWWTMPPNDTGAPITFLTRCTSSNGGVTRQATGDTGVWVDNLTRGRTYTCFVRATNSRGSTNSARSNAVKVP